MIKKMPNENTYRDCKCKTDEVPQNADYVHNSSTPIHCCDNDKCECHHPLRLWAIKYEVTGVAKFSGVAVVQAKDLCNAQYVFIQNSKFNGFREYIHILCIEELYPNPEPVLLLEDSAAIINHRDLKSYPFLLKSDYEQNIQNISDNVIEAVEDYIEHNPIQQVQSNWNETDETSKAYILNKPTIPVVDLTKAKADELYQPKGNYALTEDLFSGSYNDLTDKPSLFSGNYNDLTGKPTLFSGSYNDLSDKPTIPEAQVNADWESESGKSQILNKPTDLVRKSDIEGLLRNDGSVYTGKYLEQVEDLDNFQASEGKIVQYIGATNSKYTNGFNYKKVGTQTVIPAGTDFIRVSYDDNLKLGEVGIENGIYYKTDKKDEITSNIREYFLANLNNYGIVTDCSVPVIYENTSTYPQYTVQEVYAFYKENNRTHFDKIAKATYSTVSNVRIPYRVTFKDGTVAGSSYLSLVGHTFSGVGNGEPIPESKIVIFENVLGQKIYCIETDNQVYNLKYKMLVLNNMGDYYQVVNPDKSDYTLYTYFRNGTTTEEQIIGDINKWQQCIPPEEDTSHYVLDSEIGWIEH